MTPVNSLYFIAGFCVGITLASLIWDWRTARLRKKYDGLVQLHNRLVKDVTREDVYAGIAHPGVTSTVTLGEDTVKITNTGSQPYEFTLAPPPDADFLPYDTH